MTFKLPDYAVLEAVKAYDAAVENFHATKADIMGAAINAFLNSMLEKGDARESAVRLLADGEWQTGLYKIDYNFPVIILREATP
jgi:DNA-binding MltR family transcriptional regulator